MSKQKRKISKIANRIAGICLLFGLSYCTYIFGTAEMRVKKLCPQMVGMSFDELTVFGERHGLNKPHKMSGVIFMKETKTYGRWGCQIEIENGKVVYVEYSFLD